MLRSLYVFDVESREVEEDMHYYQTCLEAIMQNSPEAQVFLFDPQDGPHPRGSKTSGNSVIVFASKMSELQKCSLPHKFTGFQTSIWDETLYKAWSEIVRKLVPNIGSLQMHLDSFAGVLDADEILLFEKATFLVIAHSVQHQHNDIHRFEKISNIVKQFKLSCSKLQAQLHSMEVRNSSFAAFIDSFTANTYVMVIISDSSIPSAATLLNIQNARKHFEKLEQFESGFLSSAVGLAGYDKETICVRSF
eukprot:Em0795g4a